jgi:hypothetical protein
MTKCLIFIECQCKINLHGQNISIKVGGHIEIKHTLIVHGIMHNYILIEMDYLLHILKAKYKSLSGSFQGHYI